jgi:hypothetical protein
MRDCNCTKYTKISSELFGPRSRRYCDSVHRNPSTSATVWRTRRQGVTQSPVGLPVLLMKACRTACAALAYCVQLLAV